MTTDLPRSQWHSFTSYVLVTTGAIVGLGNVFEFPLLANKYGGLFLLCYFLCQLLIMLPLLFAELLIGRRAKQNPVGCFTLLAMECNANYRWRIVGWLCFLVSFFTLCYYTVSAAFPMRYFFTNLTTLIQLSPSSNTSSLLSDMAQFKFPELEISFLVFLGLAACVIYRGINRGLEKISVITVPLYFIIFIGLAIYIGINSDMLPVFSQLINFHVDAPIMEIFLAALALAFLKYKVGMGTMIVYGSYLPYHVSLAKSTVTIVIIDAIISLLSYFIIVPLSIASQADSTQLLLSNHYIVTVFTGIPHGVIVALFFFFATILAAWTPIIAVLETTVVTIVECFNRSRAQALTMILIPAFLLGTLDVMLHFHGENIKLFGLFPLYHFIKNMTVDILTPITAFFIAIFAAWIMTRETTRSELGFKPWLYNIWKFSLQWLTPVSIFIVLTTVTVLEYSSF
jgi:NSS family neurotransmitter:Na+ symporter